jgi:hypothetical protein
MPYTRLAKAASRIRGEQRIPVQSNTLLGLANAASAI